MSSSRYVFVFRKKAAVLTLVILHSLFSLQAYSQSDSANLNPAKDTLQLATGYFNNGNADSAAYLLKAMLIEGSGGHDSSRIGTVFTALANYCADNGLYDDALIYYKKSLNYSDTSFKRGIAQNHSGLAQVYFIRKEYKTALYHDSLAIVNYSGADRREIGKRYNHIASIYNTQARYSNAERLILKTGLRLFSGDDPLRIEAFNQLAYSYLQRSRLSEAKWFYIQANMLSRTKKRNSGIISSLLGLARVKIKIGDYALAMRDLNEAERLSRTKGLVLESRDTYKTLYAYYQKTGDTKKGMSALRTSTRWQDTLNAQFATRQQVALAVKNRFEKELLPHQVKAPVAAKEVPKGNNWVLLLLIPIILALCGALFYFLRKKP